MSICMLHTYIIYIYILSKAKVVVRCVVQMWGAAMWCNGRVQGTVVRDAGALCSGTWYGHKVQWDRTLVRYVAVRRCSMLVDLDTCKLRRLKCASGSGRVVVRLSTQSSHL